MAITFLNSTGFRRSAASTVWANALSTRDGSAGLVVGVGVGGSSTTVVKAVRTSPGNVAFTFAARANSPRPLAGAELWYLTTYDTAASATTGVEVLFGPASTGTMIIGQFVGISTANALGSVSAAGIEAVSSVHDVPEVVSSGAAIAFYRFQQTTGGALSTVSASSQTIFQSTVLATPLACALYHISADNATNTGRANTTAAVMHAGAMALFFDTVAGEPGAFYYGGTGFSLMGLQR